MKNILKKFLKPKLKKISKYNFHYFLYWLYELQSGKILLHNSGYLPSALNDENAHKFQLYLELMAAAEVTQTQALTLCDIGCGQGHGTVFLLQNYLNKNSQITGLDISKVAIRYCKWKYQNLKNAAFKVNQHGIPFADKSVDIFLSVGSGVQHSKEYLQEIYRCLKPSGVFIFYGTYKTKKEQVLDRQLSRNGFEIIKKMNVTANIVEALIYDNNKKQTQLTKLRFLPKKAVDFLDNYTAAGTVKFESYQSNNLNGFIYALRKLPKLPVRNIALQKRH